MTDKTYNGWTNYATWRVNLEIFDGIDPRDLMTEEKDPYEVGLYLKEYVTDYLEMEGKGLSLDYALAFIANVNWNEIAKHMLEEYAEEEAAA
jgi:hypothetical protein